MTFIRWDRTAPRFVIPPFFDPPNPRISPLDPSRGRADRLQDGGRSAGEEHRRRRDQHDLRYLVARRFSLGAVFSQFDRHSFRGGERQPDVAGDDHAREDAKTPQRRAGCDSPLEIVDRIIPIPGTAACGGRANIAEIEMTASRALLADGGEISPAISAKFLRAAARPISSRKQTSRRLLSSSAGRPAPKRSRGFSRS